MYMYPYVHCVQSLTVTLNHAASPELHYSVHSSLALKHTLEVFFRELLALRHYIFSPSIVVAANEVPLYCHRASKSGDLMFCIFKSTCLLIS